MMRESSLRQQISQEVPTFMQMATLATALIQFYEQIRPPRKLPKGIAVLFPQANKEVLNVVATFCQKYYSDNRARSLTLGINPGRKGAGITGVNFTAPRQLALSCGIEHPWDNSSELSAEFIYEAIDAYGGPAAFYADHFISAVSPLGFTQQGININYYDDKDLQAAITPFVLTNLRKQLQMGFLKNSCICIGGEKNFKYLASLNDKHGFFEKIIPLPHPRFIMQYRRKQKQEYIRLYVETWKHCRPGNTAHT